MREIKFRAWDKETKTMISDEWIQTLDLKGDGSWTSYLGGGMKQYLTQKQSDKKITDCVLLQYTGLKDENGKEIYEGDIFKAQVNWLSKETDKLEEHDIFIGQILFCNFEWVFNGIVFAEDGEKINTIQLPFSEYRTGYSWGNGIEKWHSTFTSKERFTEFEVIGNIYENKELLK
jgi:uncharacterized phage protein (TIGR01671 family)